MIGTQEFIEKTRSEYLELLGKVKREGNKRLRRIFINVFIFYMSC